jgi:hypothetical protein
LRFLVFAAMNVEKVKTSAQGRKTINRWVTSGHRARGLAGKAIAALR